MVLAYPLDTGHALYSGIEAAWGFHENTGTTSEDSTGNDHGLTLNGSLSWGTINGRSVIQNAANIFSPLPLDNNVVLDGTQDWTLAWRCKQTGDNNAGMICGDITDSSDYVWFGGASGVTRYRDSVPNSHDFDLELFTTEKSYVMAFDFSDQELHFYVNGVEEADSPIACTTGDLLISNVMQGINASTFVFKGDFHYLYVWDGRELSEAEAGDLHSDPYDLFLFDQCNITTPQNLQVIQRSSGTSNIAITGTYDGSPTAIEASFNGGAYATIDASPAAGTFSGTLSSQTEGQGALTVRFTNDTSVLDTHDNFGIGDVFLIIGQSNASGQFNANNSYTHASLTASVLDENDSEWRDCTDPTDTAETTPKGSCWPILATQIMSDQSVPVGFITAAESGTALVGGPWDPLTPGANYTAAVARVTASGTNGIAAALWEQGEADANAGASQAAYNADLDSLISTLQTDTGFTFPLICSQVGTVPGNPAAALDNIRLAQVEAWGDNADVLFGIVGYDRAALHWAGNTEAATQAGRYWFAIDEALYGGSNGRGPVQATITASGSTITVTVDKALDGGTTSYATAAWTIDNDDGAARSVTSVDQITSTTIDIVADGAIDGTSPTVTFASGNTGAAVAIPAGDSVTLPVTVHSVAEIDLPLEPIIAQAVIVSAGTLLRVTQNYMRMNA